MKLKNAAFPVNKFSFYQILLTVVLPTDCPIFLIWSLIFFRVIKIIHFFQLKAQQNWLFRDILPCYENNFEISFCVILRLLQKTDLCLVLIPNTKFIFCLSVPIEYPRFTNCYEKPNKKTHEKWMGVGFFWQWVNRKHFLSACGNICSSRVAF